MTDRPIDRFATLDAPASWQAVDFMSDLHLHAGDTATQAAWLAYLDGATGTDALFILGDLFEVWVGDDNRSDYLDEVLAMFRAVGAQGAELVFCHGNRDFLLDCGPAGSTPFSAQAGGRMMAEAEVVELGGAPALLMHGDQLCTLDEAYMAFRAQARSEAWQQGILGQPLEQRLMIAEMWRMKSKMANSNKAENIMDVTPSEVVRVMATAGTDWAAGRV